MHFKFDESWALTRGHTDVVPDFPHTRRLEKIWVTEVEGLKKAAYWGILDIPHTVPMPNPKRRTRLSRF
jgi:hypothetical protein